MHRRISRLVLAASVLVWTACGGKKDVTPPPPATASIAVTSGASTLSVAQGAAGTAAITVARTNFTGDVALTAENLPTGVTATFTPASLTSGATASSLSLTASGTAATGGPTTVTIRARGTGVTDATTTIALTITAVTSGGFSIAVNPTTQSITAGQTAASAVTITRTGGFTGGVTMTVTGTAASGMTTTFSSANPVTAGTVNLSVATLTSLTPGTYTLTVRGNSTGLPEATATFAVTVGAPPANSVTWRYCDPARYPLWLAVQDGESGPWTRVTETSTGVYNFSYGQPRVGIATVMNDGSTVFTQVTYYSTAEVATEAPAECRDYPAPGTKTLTGTISGFASAQEIALVSMGAALSNSTNQSATAFTINKVPNGAVDLLAVRANVVTGTVARLLLTRGTNFASGASIGALDLSGGTSFAPASSTLTITAPNDGALIGTAVFTTATGSSASFTTPALSSGVAATYQGVPDANMIASDLQEVHVEQNVGTTIYRFISKYIRGPSAVTLAMPADPGLPTITNLAGSAYPRATATGAVTASFNNQVAIEFSQPSRSRRWELVALPGARPNLTSYAFTIPDFSALPGWQATWALGAGATDITSSFFGLTGGNPDGTPTTGTELRLTGRFSSFTFP